MAYDHKAIEKAAQEKWASLGLYTADLSDESKEKYYLLVEFPYPSGDLHIGHWYAFAVTDIYARMLRLRGKNVLFPIGFDAFGLPAENAAIRNKLDPREWTYSNMDRMRTQLRSMGASFDWSKEVVTCDPLYYQWTQWLFIKLFEHGLAERKESAVKWCPKDQTVLANEQVIDGHCERCGTEVEEKRLTQWFFKITQYAERLLEGLTALPWREEIKEAQRAWIGKSEGATINFPLHFTFSPEANENRGPSGEKAHIPVFTTRPDTIYGATALILAPEHLWVTLATDAEHHVLENKEEIKAYIEASQKKTERERSENKDKTGVLVKGVVAINPSTGEDIPIYVADFVIGSYGTGALMSVPAHDERDFEFAKKMEIPIRKVIEPTFVASKNPDTILKPDQEIIKREAVCAIVHNPKNNTYLCVSWKKALMHGLVTGGIDDGEDLVEAARREVKEETGYKNLRHIPRPEITINTFFYHRMKQQNRWAHFHYVFFELENEEREDVSAAESELHEVVWVPKNELKSFFTVFEGDFVVDVLDTPDFVYTDQGLLVNSGEFTGRDSQEVKGEILGKVGGEKTTNYRLRDWLISRQRYWGCPIPIVYDPEGKPHAIPAEHLPWLLPTDVDFTPSGKAPLASSQELQERVTSIFGEGWTPEYDTLDTFVDSSWYFTRYLDPTSTQDFSNPALMEKWLPVDRYSGGSEHTTMHLLYARFFAKALYDLTLLPVQEPFIERFNRGLIMGPDGQKMSKSKGNVVNPDEFVQKYGADAVRIYLAFIGPYSEPGSYPWKLDGVFSMQKFLERVITLTDRVDANAHDDPTLTQALAKAARKVSDDGDRFKFNTAIAAIMTLLNECEKHNRLSLALLRDFVIILSPFAPHVSEMVWEKLDGEGSVHSQRWPDTAIEIQGEAEVVVQVNGKRRAIITVATGASEEEVTQKAKDIPSVATYLKDTEPKKVIYVEGKIINFVL